MIFIIIIGRYISILLVSLLINLPRKKNYLTHKKQFFLLFAGVRGAMAYALAIKSMTDLGTTGKMFVIVTLILTGFTLFYSSLFLNCVVNACDLLKKKSNFEEVKSGEGDNNSDENGNNKSDEDTEDTDKINCFGRFKLCMARFDDNYLSKFVRRDKERNNSIIENLSEEKEKDDLEKNLIDETDMIKDKNLNKKIFSQTHNMYVNRNSSKINDVEINDYNDSDSLHYILKVEKIENFTI
jgi:hypothetical protein